MITTTNTAPARDAAIAALSDMEQAAQMLASAVSAYETAYQAISRAAHPDANRQRMLEAAVGSRRLAAILVQRMRALDLQPVLDLGRTTGTVGDTWVEDLTKQIRGLVP